MNFSITSGTGGLFGLIILAGGVAVVATIIFMLLARRVTAAPDEPIDDVAMREDEVAP